MKEWEEESVVSLKVWQAYYTYIESAMLNSQQTLIQAESFEDSLRKIREE
jgi:hypothetical protein